MMLRPLAKRTSRIKRIFRRFGLNKYFNFFINFILIYLTYKSISIIFEAYRSGDPIWYVTRYHLDSIFHKDPNLKYFEHQENKLPLVHKDIRILLKHENLKVLENLDLNYDDYFNDIENQEIKPISYQTSDGDIKTFQSMINEYLNNIQKNSIKFPHPEREIRNNGKAVIWDTIFKDDSNDKITKEKLENLMEFNDIFVTDLKLKHQNIIRSLPIEPCPYYDENNSGYVFIGGGLYTWYSFISIQSLRNSGSVLPVELMIPTKDQYDHQLCDLILPKYNTKCVILQEKFGMEAYKRIKPTGYLLKIMTILASSFKNLIYLDSDVFSVENPDYILTSEVYEKFGMITWPDFWRRTTSPKLYDIIDREIGEPIRYLNDYFTPVEYIYKDKNDVNNINFHDLNGTLPDWSTESGILVINKSTHFNSLLLTLYYNINGELGYYPLLSQGGAGEGDKETWLLAAHVLNLTYYQVNKTPSKTYGTWIKDLNWIVDSCIVQVSPIDDWEGTIGLNYIHDYWRNEHISRGGYIYNYDYSYGLQAYKYADIMGATVNNGGLTTFSDIKSWEKMDEKADSFAVPMLAEPRDMFYHVHNPKLDPWDYVLDDLFTDINGRQMRNFGDDIYTRLSLDIELWVWETIYDDLCVEGELLDALKELKSFKGRDFKALCGKRLQDRIKWLKKEGHLEKRLNGWKLVGDEREKVLNEILLDFPVIVAHT